MKSILRYAGKAALFLIVGGIFFVCAVVSCFTNSERSKTTRNPDKLRAFLIQPEELGAVWLPEAYEEITKFKAGIAFYEDTDMMAFQVGAQEDAGAAGTSIVLRHTVTQYQSAEWLRETFGEKPFTDPPDYRGVDPSDYTLHPDIENTLLSCNEPNEHGIQFCVFYTHFGRYETNVRFWMDNEKVTQEQFQEFITLATDKLIANANQDSESNSWFRSLFK